MIISIEEFKNKLRGLPKEIKITSIQQEINNLRLHNTHRPLQGMTREQLEHFNNNPPKPLSQEEQNKKELAEQKRREEEKKLNDEKKKLDDERIGKITELEGLLNEVKNNHEAYESKTKRTELIPFMYDRTLNWYFNEKNIPAQKNLVLPTFEYFEEGAGKDSFQTLDFFNLFYKQYNGVKESIYEPFTVLDNLNAIPLAEKERHVLLGFILKWFGGYPVNNMDQQYNTVLKLIEKQFLKYPGDTPEKEFCRFDVDTRKKINEVAAHLSAEMGLPVHTIGHTNKELSKRFPTSRYIGKVDFDFENLPHYIIEKGIIANFEGKRFGKDDEYLSWQKKLSEFLLSIPEEHRIKALEKGIGYGEAVYNFHQKEECTNLTTCKLDETWQRRIGLAKAILGQIRPEPVQLVETQPEITTEKNRDYTTARQVLAVHYIMEFLQVKNVDATEKARFIQFLTGKETGAKAIQNTNIYKKIKSPLSTDEKTLLEDLQFVRIYFEKLGLTEIAKAITNEISSRE